jgi:hemerythrin
MPIEWTSDLSVGVVEIDRQHQELFQRINRLFDACYQGTSKATVAEMIQFLADYVVSHFGTEEKYMIQFNYPDYATHKTHHQQFIASFQEVKNKLDTDGPGPHLVILTNRLVVSWLNAHIRNVDKLLGAFLKGKV